MTVTRRISKIIKDGIEYNIVGGGSEAVDTCLDTTSENPVQNKVIAQAINGKQDALTAGPNICMYTENDVKKICAVDTTYTNATQSSAGLMSASDKKKLDTLIPGGLKMGRIDYLIVGGGGGGGKGTKNIGAAGGGGGGGGVIYRTGQIIYSGACYAYVGSGGSSGYNGGYSCFNSETAYGGGAGGNQGCNGCNGASGGGGGGSGYCCSGGTCCSGQGYSGGTSYLGGGGGGGAGGVGSAGTSSKGGAGGPGRSIAISGASVYYGAGGGGGEYGCGGTGGGGDGAHGHCLGCPGTGYGAGGGGAGCNCGCNGGAGKAGIIIIRYKKDGSDGIVCATGGTKYECGNYCIHCFTSSGYFYPFAG